MSMRQVVDSVQPSGSAVIMPEAPARREAELQLARVMAGRDGIPVANLTILVDQGNYGQRLQTYALQRYFRDEFGKTLVTMDIDNSRFGIDPGDDLFFHRFERECLNIVSMRDAPPGFLDRFSYVVVGGDQAFNIVWRCPATVVRLISGMQRRCVFSYGAGSNPTWRSLPPALAKSMGVFIAAGLREDYGYWQDRVVTVDPVFLLHDRWHDVERGAGYVGGTFTYNVRGSVTALSRTTADGTVVCNNASVKTGAVDPRDFLGLIRGADRVVTNSYHGFCFALLYRVPRIKLLLDDHRMRHLVKLLHVRIEDEVVRNYDEIFERIAAEVARARDFIDMCLKSSPTDYCGYSRDQAVRDASSSGGAMFELARSVFERGGVVYGAAFSPDFKRVVPERVTTVEEYAARLSKSKYSFCPLPDVAKVREDLGTGREVMYIGSPCHVRALKKLLGSVPDNLVCVDFRCRGYSSPDKLAKFVDDLQSRTGKRISSLDFRPQHGFDVRVGFDDVSSLMEKRNDFIFDSLPMCRRCPFGHGMLSCADLTVGDFWLNDRNSRGYGDEFTPQRGCNLVSANSARGLSLVGRVMDRMVLKPVIVRDQDQSPENSKEQPAVQAAGVGSACAPRFYSASMSLEDFFSNSFVLSIDQERLDRFYALFRESFTHCRNLPRTFTGFRTVGHTSFARVMLGHAAIVRMAQSLGLPFVVIFEDDAYPHDDAEDVLGRLLANIPDPSGVSGIVQLGWTLRKGGRLSRIPGLTGGYGHGPQYAVLSGGECYGLHSYMVPDRLYSRFIESFDATVSTSLLRRFGGSFLTLDTPLFIQSAIKPGNYNKVGFVYNGVNGVRTPPRGFTRDRGLQRQAGAGRSG